MWNKTIVNKIWFNVSQLKKYNSLLKYLNYLFKLIFKAYKMNEKVDFFKTWSYEFNSN